MYICTGGEAESLATEYGKDIGASMCSGVTIAPTNVARDTCPCFPVVARGRCAVVLKHRRGFVRLALQYGATLVPPYGFGNTSMYSTLSWGKQFRNWCATVHACKCGDAFACVCVSGVWAPSVGGETVHPTHVARVPQPVF